MFPLGPEINEYVVYEDYDKLIQEWPKDPVHILHEHYRSIGHPKAVFCSLSAFTNIWWYPNRKSIFENTDNPCN